MYELERSFMTARRLLLISFIIVNASSATDCSDLMVQCDYSYSEKGFGTDEQGTIECYDSILQQCPNNAAALYRYSQKLREVGENDRALLSIEKAIQLSPDLDLNPQLPDFWYEKSVILRNMNELNKALSSINRSIELSKSEWASWYKKGEILIKLSRYEESVEAFAQAARNSPDDISPLYQEALALYHLGKHNESIQICDEAIKILESNPMLYFDKGEAICVWRCKGEAYHALEQDSSAENAFKKAESLENIDDIFSDEQVAHPLKYPSNLNE